MPISKVSSDPIYGSNDPSELSKLKKKQTDSTGAMKPEIQHEKNDVKDSFSHGALKGALEQLKETGSPTATVHAGEGEPGKKTGKSGVFGTLRNIGRKLAGREERASSHTLPSKEALMLLGESAIREILANTLSDLQEEGESVTPLMTLAEEIRKLKNVNLIDIELAGMKIEVADLKKRSDDIQDQITKSFIGNRLNQADALSQLTGVLQSEKKLEGKLTELAELTPVPIKTAIYEQLKSILEDLKRFRGGMIFTGADAPGATQKTPEINNPEPQENITQGVAENKLKEASIGDFVCGKTTERQRPFVFVKTGENIVTAYAVTLRPESETVTRSPRTPRPSSIRLSFSRRDSIQEKSKVLFGGETYDSIRAFVDKTTFVNKPQGQRIDATRAEMILQAASRGNYIHVTFGNEHFILVNIGSGKVEKQQFTVGAESKEGVSLHVNDESEDSMSQLAEKIHEKE